MIKQSIRSVLTDIWAGRLRIFGVDQKLMFFFYQAVLESLIRFGNLSVQVKSKLNRLVQTAMKVIGRTENSSLQSIYEESVLRLAQRASSDSAHILNPEYQLLPSGKRYRTPICKFNRFKYSFIPTSIRLINKTL